MAKTAKKFTHVGTLLGDARTANKTPTVKLRETANFWVSEHGYKYRKLNGSAAGQGDWALYSLQIETVKELTNAE